MFSKIRSLIFKLDPETAHDLAIKALKFNLVSQNKIKNNKSIQAEIFGKIIPNPIGIAAGFDKDAEVYNPLFRLGFGFVEVGTITPLKQYGNLNADEDIIFQQIKFYNPEVLFIGDVNLLSKKFINC